MLITVFITVLIKTRVIDVVMVIIVIVIIVICKILSVLDEKDVSERRGLGFEVSPAPRPQPLDPAFNPCSLTLPEADRFKLILAMPFYPYAGGWLELIVGPMFSGKSEELIRRVTRAVIARQSVQVFKPALDNRYDLAAVASHNGRRFEAVAVRDVAELESQLKPESQVVAIDEGQFLSGDLVSPALELAGSGKRVIIAGLDMDFRGEPFGPIPELLARAESVVKLTAICACGRAATRTQRLVNGRPAHASDPVILVGTKESYEPRCRACHVVLRDARKTPLFAPSPAKSGGERLSASGCEAGRSGS